jgi:hypothetical protein
MVASFTASAKNKKPKGKIKVLQNQKAFIIDRNNESLFYMSKSIEDGKLTPLHF